MTYVSRIVASAHNEGTVYATFDGHRSNDFKAYVHRSTDYGKTWTSISSNLPESSVQVIREHPRASSLLFAGNEVGAYYSGNGGRAVPRDPDYNRYPNSGRYPTYPSYPNSRRYPDAGRYPNGGYGGGYYSPASDKGFSDGYEKGLDDGRDNDRFDPTRQKWYRQGDRGYERQYGSKDAYKNQYRDAFRQGYERGYQDSRTGRNSRDNGGFRWPW